MEYYKDPAKTKEAIRGGYWHSGDLGMINEKGHLKFADRLKDYLRIGGENVSSSVVEAVLRKHPSVLEAAIVGHKGALDHDEIVAHVVPKEGASIDPKDLFEFCTANMAYFMVPRYLVVRKEYHQRREPDPQITAAGHGVSGVEGQIRHELSPATLGMRPLR
jgi:acyl-CoA synthetase (AMP-forming)/AMP-acid ligase II